MASASEINATGVREQKINIDQYYYLFSSILHIHCGVLPFLWQQNRWNGKKAPLVPFSPEAESRVQMQVL
jgi:hypothetical protein